MTFWANIEDLKAAYDPVDNGAKCYTLAIREIRLQGIRDGLFQPRPDDPEEMAAAGAAVAGIEASHHRVSS